MKFYRDFELEENNTRDTDILRRLYFAGLAPLDISDLMFR